MLKNILTRYQNKGPFVYDITVSSLLSEKMGFKSNQSSFYFITDKNLRQEEVPHKKEILQEIKKDFKGVYCSAGIEKVEDIRSDLKKYCTLMSCTGLVKINGREETIDPNLPQPQYPKKTRD